MKQPDMSATREAKLNALCDALMREGIDGRQPFEAVARTFRLSDIYRALGRKDCIPTLLAWHKIHDRNGVGGKTAVLLDYNWAATIAETRYGTKWQWDQSTLAREIFLLRRGLSRREFSEIPAFAKCKYLNNLGNRMGIAGRLIEACEYWRRVLEVDPTFGMALCNRANVFSEYAAALPDLDEQNLFLWMAHREATAALAPTAFYTDPEDSRAVQRVKKLKDQIESHVDIARITAQNPLAYEDTSATQSERDYRSWSLINGLYLNPRNDLWPHCVDTTDTMTLARHVVPTDAPHTFNNFFFQMKQEFVSARWLLYEGMFARQSHFSDREVFLEKTVPLTELSLGVEKIKTAYKTCYSLFDKIAFFINHYMHLNIPERRISFRGLWRSQPSKPIRIEFDRIKNWGFCALFWLAKDFFETEAGEVAEPQARDLSDIRNSLEHKYLRITTTDAPAAPSVDLALTVSREEFERKAVHLAKLARSAIMYLAVGFHIEEERRQAERSGEERRHPSSGGTIES